jgi:hypothetical protein
MGHAVAHHAPKPLMSLVARLARGSLAVCGSLGYARSLVSRLLLRLALRDPVLTERLVLSALVAA